MSMPRIVKHVLQKCVEICESSMKIRVQLGLRSTLSFHLCNMGYAATVMPCIMKHVFKMCRKSGIVNGN